LRPPYFGKADFNPHLHQRFENHPHISVQSCGLHETGLEGHFQKGQFFVDVRLVDMGILPLEKNFLP
jgi:hypothetical protein